MKTNINKQYLQTQVHIKMQYQVFYPNSPPQIMIEGIARMKNISQLLLLERRYDSFLKRNQHLLLLSDNIENYLDIRDALIVQIQRLQRDEKRQQYKEKSYIQTISIENDNRDTISSKPSYCEYDHSFQYILPPQLRLTQIQILQGFVPCPNEPKEYKCGCLSIKYYSQCMCKTKGGVCQNINCNEKKYPQLKSQAYCLSHSRLVATQTDLEKKLTKIKKDLNDIRRNSNSLDYDDYRNSIATYAKERRISRFPWKNI